MYRNTYKIRAFTLLAVLVVWAVAITAHLFYYSVFAAQEYVKMGDAIAWRRGTIPAPRGRIYDKNGTMLAWTERYYDLYMMKISDLESAKPTKQLKHLENLLGKLTYIKKRDGMLLKKSLSPENISSISNELASSNRFKIVPRLERRVIDYPNVKIFIGKTGVRAGLASGTSGVELKYNATLTGTDGTFVFMLDRNRSWIPGTWQKLTEVTPGSDITLNHSWEEIESGKLKHDN